MMRSRALTHGGMAVGLVAACLFLFRGTMNLVNAWLVPLILWHFLGPLSKTGRRTAVVAYVLMIVFLHPLQLAFSIVYLVIWRLLQLLPERTRWWDWFPVWFGTWLGFAVAITVTDRVLGIPLLMITRNLGRGTWVGFWTVLAVQATVVTVGLLIARNVVQRVQNGT